MKSDNSICALVRLVWKCADANKNGGRARTGGCCCCWCDEVVWDELSSSIWTSYTGVWVLILTLECAHSIWATNFCPASIQQERGEKSAAACVGEEETDAKALTPARPPSPPHLHSSKTSLMPLQIQVSHWRRCKLIRVCTESAIVLISPAHTLSRCWLVNGQCHYCICTRRSLTSRGPPSVLGQNGKNDIRKEKKMLFLL